jgi:hypothetical protein
MVSHVF